MSVLTRITELVNPGAKWQRIASELPDDAPTLSADTRAAIGDAFPAASAGGSYSHAWRQPPSRGTGDLLVAYMLSPMFRAVVTRCVQAYARVPFYDDRGRDNHVYNSPVINLMNNYNPRLIGSQGKRLEQTYLDVCGESITVLFPVAGERRLELYPVAPTWVTIETEAGVPEYVVRMSGKHYRFAEHEVLHRRELDLTDPYGRGRGGGLAVSDEIESDEYAAKFSKGYFFNATVPEFIASVKGATEAQAKDLERKFQSRHGGFRKAWQPSFTSAEITIHELTRKLGDERIEELRRYWSDVVRWLYGIPPEIIGLVDNSNRATIQEARQIMGEFVTDPRCQYYQETWQQVIAPAFGNPRIAYESPIPRVFDRRDEIMSRHAYHFTRNEVRKEAGFDEVRDGDLYAMPSNLEGVNASRTIRDAGSKTPLRLIGDAHE